MLTELQAWEVLFKGFAKPEQPSEDHHDGWANINGMLKECLCDAIHWLEGQRYITEGVSENMEKKISRYARPDKSTPLTWFFWPRTQEGAYERAKFCARMIEQTYKELFKAFGLGDVPFKDITHMWYI